MKKLISTVLFALIFTSCAIMSNFDQNTLNAATKIKADAIALIPAAVDPAEKHTAEIEALKAELSSQVAYEQGKGKANTISCAQWDLIASEKHELLGKFLKDWQGGKTYSPAFLIEEQQIISDSFDQILKLEGAKPK